MDLIYLTTYHSVPGVLDNLHITSFNPPIHLEINCIMNFYSNRLPHLWNSLPTIDLTLSTNVIISKIKEIPWQYFITNSWRSMHLTLFCPCTKCCNHALNFFHIWLYLPRVLAQVANRPSMHTYCCYHLPPNIIMHDMHCKVTNNKFFFKCKFSWKLV